jgi:hypothetical protein
MLQHFVCYKCYHITACLWFPCSRTQLLICTESKWPEPLVNAVLLTSVYGCHFLVAFLMTATDTNTCEERARSSYIMYLNVCSMCHFTTHGWLNWGSGIWKYEFQILQSQKVSAAYISTMKTSEQISNNLVLINSPNTYSLTPVKFSFWSDSTTNLNLLLKSFQLVGMNEKLLTSVMNPVIYPVSLLNTPQGKQNTPQY